MKNNLYIIIFFFLILSSIHGQEKIKDITPFYLYYKYTGLRSVNATIEIKNNRVINYKVEQIGKKPLKKRIKMDKLSFKVFKSRLVEFYKILELPRENMSCKTCIDSSLVELKFNIGKVERDIAANNPGHENLIFREIENYLMQVIGRLPVN